MQVNKVQNERKLQDDCRYLVEREVILNVSTLIHELSKQVEYSEEILEVCTKYEPDEEDPIEALEHWVVTPWLADQLEDRGEMVLRDFLGLPAVWGRTCSGQAILLDSVIRDITKELHS